MLNKGLPSYKRLKKVFAWMIFIAYVYATKQDMGMNVAHMFLLLHDFFFFVKVSKPNMVWAKK